MIRKNAIQKSESMRSQINPRFDISCNQLIEVINHYTSSYAECGLAFFRLGYMQGQKAAKAEQERKKKFYE